MPITDGGGQVYAGDYHDHVVTDWYLPIFVDARNNSAVLWSLMPSTSENIAGKFVTYPVRKGRNEGISAVGHRGKIADPGAGSADQHTFMTRTVFARVLIDGETYDDARNNAAAYVDLVTFELEGLIDDIIQEQNRMLHSDGSGRLCEVVGEAALTVTVEINQDVEGSATCDTAPTRHIRPGMKLAFVEPDGTGLKHATVVTVPSDTTFTIDAITSGSGDDTGATINAGDWVVHTAGVSTGYALKDCAFRHEPMGFEGIMSDANIADGNGLAVGQTGADGDTTAGGVGFQGLDATAAGNEFNQAVVRDNGGVKRAITEDLLQEAIWEAERRNNADIGLLLSNGGPYNDYVSTLVTDKRFNDTQDLKGGHKTLDFNGLPWVKDRSALDNRVKGIDMDQVRVYEKTPLSYVDWNGQKWKRLEDDEDYQLAMKYRCTVGTDVRQRIGFHLVDLEN